MNETRIQEGLAALAKSEDRVPSPAIEAALLRELKRKPHIIGWKAALFAGAVAAGLAWLFVARQAKVVEVPSIARKVPAPAAIYEPPPAPAIAVARARKPRRARPIVVAQRDPAPVEFLEVPFSAPLGSDERAQLLRVTMPAGTLATWGFPPSPGDPTRTINADVVVGENGLARAVRLVR